VWWSDSWKECPRSPRPTHCDCKVVHAAQLVLVGRPSPRRCSSVADASELHTAASCVRRRYGGPSTRASAVLLVMERHRRAEPACGPVHQSCISLHQGRKLCIGPRHAAKALQLDESCARAYQRQARIGRTSSSANGRRRCWRSSEAASNAMMARWEIKFFFMQACGRRWLKSSALLATLSCSGCQQHVSFR